MDVSAVSAGTSAHRHGNMNIHSFKVPNTYDRLLRQGFIDVCRPWAKLFSC